MSDRIAVMSGGRVEQIATPELMYEEPETVFVADFLGVSNLMEVTAEGRDGGRAGRSSATSRSAPAVARSASVGETHVVIRPERVVIEPYEASGDNRVPGMIERVVYHGASDQLVVRLATGNLVQALFVNDGSQREWSQGTPVQVHFPAEALRVLPPGRGLADPAPAAPPSPEDSAPALEVGTS